MDPQPFRAERMSVIFISVGFVSAGFLDDLFGRDANVRGGEVQLAPEGACTDNDGGLNFDVQGKIEIRNTAGSLIFSRTDSCASVGQLEEWFCADGRFASSTIRDCPSGVCENGACRAVCVPQCSGKQCGADGCGGTCGSCPSGQQCNSAGQCSGGGSGECVDSDGDNPNVKGIVTWKGSTFTDACVRSNLVTEYICQTDRPIPKSHICTNQCYNGACI